MTSTPRERQEGLIPELTSQIKHAVLAPVKPVVSRTALRSYLTTILLASAAFTLLGLSIVAYTLFYWSYIPRIGFERTLYLQFDTVYKSHDALHPKAHPFPYGSASLANDIVSAQGYDVWVELAMPRTRENQDAGNFMLELNMYAPSDKGSSIPGARNILAPVRADISPDSSSVDTSLVLASSRRPAILPYRSRHVDMLQRLTELHWYLLGVRGEEAKLRVPMFERVSFTKGVKNVPSTVRLEIQSTHRLQIYSAKVLFRARFRGLRWVMYNQRVTAAILFTSAFWVTSVVFTVLAWLGLTVFLGRTEQHDAAIKAEQVHEAAEGIKQENEDEVKPLLSDTERTFPTLSAQQPLRYTSPTPDIKPEPEDEAAILVAETVIKDGEADIEDEDDDDGEEGRFLDSGIGTSLESSGPGRRDSMRRRRGRQGPSSSVIGSSHVWRDD